MRVSNRLSRAFLVLAALPWAAGWVMLGLWVLIGAAASSPESAGGLLPTGVRWTVGITSIAAGQLVFMCFVADRVFPRAASTPVWAAELATCAILFLGVAALIGQLAVGAMAGAGWT